MRLIDADELKERVLSYAGMFTDEGFVVDQSAVLGGIDFSPTIEAEPVKHGRWNIFDDGGYKDAAMSCSCCGIPYENYASAFHYCPNCGAKMDLEG